jgi:hypothetical protein
MVQTHCVHFCFLGICRGGEETLAGSIPWEENIWLGVVIVFPCNFLPALLNIVFCENS